MGDIALIEAKFEALSGSLDEAALRLWAATEARSLGRGGVTTVAKAIGMSRTTIYRGLAELQATAKSPEVASETKRRVRAAGGGRPRLTTTDANLLQDLDGLIEPTSRSDAIPPLRWTSMSTYRLAEELQRLGHKVSQRTVCNLLTRMEYTIQSTPKTRKGEQHGDWDARFAHIAQIVADYQAAGDPVISIEIKKNELFGDVSRAGNKEQPKGTREKVRVHEFIDPDPGKVTSHGINHLTTGDDCLNVGIDQDTAEFAVESIRHWWREMGEVAHPRASRLLITTEFGDRNGYRFRPWQMELQKFADQFELPVEICRFPPGTRKWNKIEHRMFFQRTVDWQERRLISRQVIVSLIGSSNTWDACNGRHRRKHLRKGH